MLALPLDSNSLLRLRAAWADCGIGACLRKRLRVQTPSCKESSPGLRGDLLHRSGHNSHVHTESCERLAEVIATRTSFF